MVTITQASNTTIIPAARKAPAIPCAYAAHDVVEHLDNYLAEQARARAHFTHHREFDDYRRAAWECIDNEPELTIDCLVLDDNCPTAEAPEGDVYSWPMEVGGEAGRRFDSSTEYSVRANVVEFSVRPVAREKGAPTLWHVVAKYTLDTEQA